MTEPRKYARPAMVFILAAFGAMLALGFEIEASPAKKASYLLVLNKAASTLVLVDPTTKEIVSTIPTGKHPHEVDVSGDGKTAYVANYGAQEPGSSVSVVDLAARSVVRTIDLGEYRRPHGILAGPDGKVYVTCEQNRVLLRLDPAAGKVEKIYETGQAGSHMVVITADGKRAFTANIPADTVTAIDLATGAVTQIPVGKGPEGITLSPDGREVWVAHRGDGGLSVIDASSLKVKETLPKFCEMPIRAEHTPDGRSVLVSCAEGHEIVVFDPASRKIRARVATGEAPIGIQITPDSKTAYVANTAADKVSIVSLSDGKVTGTIAPGDEPDGMAWTELD